VARKAAVSKIAELVVPGWMVTFSDTITLLLTFFVLLLSFSGINKEKYGRMAGALQGYLGVAGRSRFNMDGLLVGPRLMAGRVFVEGYENPPEYDPMKYMQDDIRMRVQAHSEYVANALQYRLTEQGLELHVAMKDIFEPGLPHLRPDAGEILGVVGEAVRHLPHPVRVQTTSDPFGQGYTGRPIGTRLSLLRASEICRFLVEQSHVESARIQASVALAPNPESAMTAAQDDVQVILMRLQERKTP